jgi:hypothetical protein
MQDTFCVHTARFRMRQGNNSLTELQVALSARRIGSVLIVVDYVISDSQCNGKDFFQTRNTLLDLLETRFVES